MSSSTINTNYAKSCKAIFHQEFERKHHFKIKQKEITNKMNIVIQSVIDYLSENSDVFTMNYKTKPCFISMKKKPCPDGPTCNFAHSLPSYLASNLRKNPKFKTEYCRNKRCANQYTCPFIHDKDDVMQISNDWTRFGWGISNQDDRDRKEAEAFSKSASSDPVVSLARNWKEVD